jgi:hypothetical protein
MTGPTAAPELRNGQTEVDILTRHGIPLELGGERIYRVRPRTMKKDKAWIDQVFARVTGRFSSFMVADLSVQAVIEALNDSPNDMLDLVIAYEEEGQERQLPPREWLEDHAYTAQITTAFTTLLEVAYPPFAVSRRLLPADRASAIIGSLLTVAIEETIQRRVGGSSEPTVLPSASGATARRKRSTQPSRTGSSSS